MAVEKPSSPSSSRVDRSGPSMSRVLVALATLSGLMAVVWLVVSGSGEEPADGRIRLSLEGEGTIYLKEIDEHTYHYLVNKDGRVHELSAEEFAEQLYRERIARPWWKRILNITSAAGIACRWNGSG